RATMNMPQAERAKRVGVRRQTLRQLEKGKYNPSLQLAHDLAKALPSTIDEIFIFED
ncbi:helix-turn-helix transcriptional regulator, partial [Bacillus cereus]|nr:helix-turn-helix transcriptional regulator [Bacillus cereus]